MTECPDCGGYNTAGHATYDADTGEWWYTEWTCRDCGAEWIEDDDDREGDT